MIDLSEKKVVIPGELVTEERIKLGSHVFVENGKVYSDALGLVYENREIASVIPLKGKYSPHRGDLVVGIVNSEKFSGYSIDLGLVNSSYISKDLVRDRLQRGTVISAKIAEVDEMGEAKLDEVRVFYGGEILSISPVKVPRVIGKEGSMLNTLKDGTGSNLLVGRNGWIWAKGGDTDLLSKAINLIDEEAHLSNLTNKVGEFLTKNKVEK